ncbi:unnamed protein product [Lactuca saligna]|uniref:Uncharacterized protein n=1 Tax=Lactuca saligna TaxID=75948 RepID=A0AA35Y7W6_LACSI|nr:unnamed protein product [Lactuca saligna]
MGAGWGARKKTTLIFVVRRPRFLWRWPCVVAIMARRRNVGSNGHESPPHPTVVAVSPVGLPVSVSSSFPAGVQAEGSSAPSWKREWWWWFLVLLRRHPLNPLVRPWLILVSTLYFGVCQLPLGVLFNVRSHPWSMKHGLYLTLRLLRPMLRAVRLLGIPCSHKALPPNSGLGVYIL